MTASYPNDHLTAWLASSKAHGLEQPHYLTVYAIGLKIEGMSRRELLESIYINTQRSGWGNLPEATAGLPDRFLLVSGGFKVHWTGYGNLATASFPSTNLSWTAKSKAHHQESPATLEVFAIGLREQLPVGRLRVAINTRESSVSDIPSSSADVDPGFVLTGGGAEVHWRGYGNLIWRLEPIITTTNQEFVGSSKAHIEHDPSTITTYAVGVRLVES